MSPNPDRAAAAVPPARRPLTRELARHAVQSRFDALPAPVQAEAARALVNWVGCALGGSQEPSVAAAARGVARLGGAPQAALVGRSQRSDVASAALVNCIASTCQAFDDAHLPTVTHPSSPAGAAVVALAELLGAPGEELANALVLAIEVTCRLSNALALPPSAFHTGFYLTGLSAPVGVALAAGRLLRLTEAQMANAVVLAASQASGFRSTNGTMSGHFRPGHAARSGIVAALLAQEGFSNDGDDLEVEQGFFDVFAPGADLDRALEGLGQQHELFANAYKPYPCGVVIHPSLDACLEIQAQAGAQARPVDVTLHVHPFTLRLCGLRTPATRLESHVSLYHWVAAALLRGGASLMECEPACIQDPEVAALRERIQAVPDASLGRDQAVAEVRYADGRTLRSHTVHVRGSLERPMTDSELDAKFRTQAALVLPGARAEELLGVCREVARRPDAVRRIVTLWQP